MATEAVWRIALAVEALASVEGPLEAFLETNNVDGNAAYVSRLIVEEIVRNLIQHTPPYETNEFADVRVVIEPANVTLMVDDERPPFDPHDAAAFDTRTPLEQRRAGGMGIHLVRNLADALSYERVGNRNRLTATVRRA